MSLNPFDRLARFYDWEQGDFDDDVAFYVGLARRTGGPVLEGACGTGRLLTALAGTGLQVVGLDSSPAMLDIAARRLAAFGASVRLELADLRTFELQGDFALAIVALDSFGFLLERGDQLAALSRLRAALKPGGLLALDVANGNLRGGEASLETSLQLALPHPEHDGQLQKWLVRQTDHARQVDELLAIYDETSADGVVRRTSIVFNIRYFCRFELEGLLETAGLELEALYGDYETGAYGADSQRLLAVARRT